MGIAIIGKILIGLILIATGYVCYHVVADGIKRKKSKYKYVQKIKADICYLEILADCPPFVSLPDDHSIDVQNCLYRIADLNANEIIKNEALRNFMTDHRNLEDSCRKSWHQYILVL